MSWLSSLYGSNEAPRTVVPPSNYSADDWKFVREEDPTTYAQIKEYDPQVIAARKAAEDAAAHSTAVSSVTSPSISVAPTGPQVALQQLNDALGSGFESRFEPDTIASPFVQSTLTSGRGKADEFIANMIKRGTLTESGQSGAASALDKQTSGIQSRLSDISNALLGSDRARLTDLANAARGTAQQTPEGTEFDPTPYVNQISSAGQAQAGTFGDRFSQALPSGDLFDTSGLAGAGGGVTSPQNISFDPYAQEGGKLSTGLGDTVAPAAADKKRRTSVF